MNKINKIMKLAQDCLDRKWFEGSPFYVGCECPFCIDDKKNPEDECLCPKNICNCDLETDITLMSIISVKYGVERKLKISDIGSKDLELMRQALQETAETGGISRFTRNEIERRYKEL